MIKLDPDAVIEKVLKVSIAVEEREALNIYPEFRDRELEKGNQAAVDVYHRVAESEKEHMNWFKVALDYFLTGDMLIAAS